MKLWMDLGGIILSEIKKRKQIMYNVSYMQSLEKKTEFIETETGNGS